MLQGAAAALLKEGREPTVEEVQELARQWRLSMIRDAEASERALGPLQDQVPRVQGDLHMFGHDARFETSDRLTFSRAEKIVVELSPMLLVASITNNLV